jgi:hypothetical protein
MLPEQQVDSTAVEMQEQDPMVALAVVVALPISAFLLMDLRTEWSLQVAAVELVDGQVLLVELVDAQQEMTVEQDKDKVDSVERNQQVVQVVLVIIAETDLLVRSVRVVQAEAATMAAAAVAADIMVVVVVVPTTTHVALTAVAVVVDHLIHQPARHVTQEFTSVMAW